MAARSRSSITGVVRNVMWSQLQMLTVRAGERLARRRAADDRAGLEHERAQPGLGEVGRGDQPVVPGADDDRVVVGVGPRHAAVPARRRTHHGRPVACRSVPADRQLAHLRAPDIAARLDRAQHRRPAARARSSSTVRTCRSHRPADRRARWPTAAVERVGDELDVWLLPPLAYTKSNEHAWSPGTVWLSASTLLAVLDDIGRCVAMTPAAPARVPQRPRRQQRAASTSPTASCACATA